VTLINHKGEYIKTNASIYRINAGREYNYDMEIQEFINWCNRVADYALQE